MYQILSIWRDHIEAYAPDGKPIDARERLRLELTRRGLKAADLARFVKANGKRLGLIISVGDRRFGERDIAVKADIERVLGLDTGCLSLAGQSVKRGGVALMSDDYPTDKRHLTASDRGKLSAYLPDAFLTSSDAEKIAAIEEAMLLIAQKTSPEDAARARLRQNAYALRGPLPKRLAKELASLKTFYTATFVPDGAENNRRRWALPTMRMRENTIRLIAGYLCHPSRGKAAMDPNTLSLVIVLHPRTIRAFLMYRHKRTEAEFGRSHLTDEDVNAYMLARTLLDPANGFMRQAGEFAERLVPVSASETEIRDNPGRSNEGGEEELQAAPG